MPLLNGSISSTRFRVYGPMPETASAWEDALASSWFRAPASPLTKRASGFCLLTRPLEADHPINEWAFNHYMLFGWRIDEKKIDARRFKAVHKVRMEAWCKENSRPRCPAAVREELKEQLEMEMLEAMQPSLRVLGLVVNVNERYLLLDSSNTAVIEEVTKVFSRQLNLRLVEDGLAGESITGGPTPSFPVLFSSFDARSGTVALGEPSTAVEVAPVRFSGTALSGFFAWLWGLLQSGEDMVGLPDGTQALFSLVDEVRFASTQADHDEVVVRIEDPTGSDEARAAAHANRCPTSVRLFLRREDREYTMSLSGPSLAISGLKVQQAVKGGETAEVLYDRMYLYEEAVWMVQALVDQYVEAALDAEGRQAMQQRWLDWLTLDEA